MLSARVQKEKVLWLHSHETLENETRSAETERSVVAWEMGGEGQECGFQGGRANKLWDDGCLRMSGYIKWSGWHMCSLLYVIYYL